MWTRAFGLLGIVVVSVFLGYLIGSNMQPRVTIPLPPPAGSPFRVSNLSIYPEKIRPNETVTITVSVANTHDAWGIYSLVLKINGVKEAEKQANVDAGSSQDVSFSVTRGEPGRYNVFINGLSGSFSVVQPLPVNWTLIGGIIVAVVVAGLAVVVAGLVVFFLLRRRAA